MNSFAPQASCIAPRRPRTSKKQRFAGISYLVSRDLLGVGQEVTMAWVEHITELSGSFIASRTR
jgi:hypothetical protein